MEVIVESPKGSSIKYKYESDRHLFRLKKILPSGLAFPYDFGFIPDTKGEDGDPLDVLVISEFQGFPGCIMDCRIIGSIQLEQKDGKEMIRNDRFIAVLEKSMVFKTVNDLEDLPGPIITSIQNFFINYMNGEGKKFELKGIVNSKKAMEVLKKEEGTG